MPTLKELKSQLLQLIATDGIAALIKALKEVLPESSPRYADVILIESRQNDANIARIRNKMSDKDLQQNYDSIRSDLVDLLQSLSEEDFDTSIPSSKHSQKKIQYGSVLYRVPNKMGLERETRCVVRIAFDEEVIIRNIDLDEQVSMQNIRVSDIMQVELLNASEQHPFEIRSITSAEQFVDEDDLTEWIFYVKPLLPGKHTLLLKIAVIETIRGKERKRELVLEQTIDILTTVPEDKAFSFNAADFKLAFGNDDIKDNSVGGASKVEENPLKHQPAKESNEPRVITQKEIEEKIKGTMARLSGAGKKKRQGRQRIKREKSKRIEQITQSGKLLIPAFISVQELADFLYVPVADLINTCKNLGIIVSVNQRLDAGVIELVSKEFGYQVEFVSKE